MTVRVRRALTVAIALAAVVVGSASSAAAATRIEPTLRGTSLQGDLVALINAYRESNGLQAVFYNGALTAAATWMAGDMAAGNYIGHVSSDGRSPTQRMSAFGYPANSMYTGEDVGAGYGTAGAVLAGWQASSAHNAVLLNPNYNAIGVGLVHNPSSAYKLYWVADFGGPGGTRKIVAPPPAPQAPAAPQTVRQAQPAERVAPAPRTTSHAADVAVDVEAKALATRTAFLRAVGARRIAHLMAVLHRMAAI
jgi:uncharacterized protein YkwD